jgi:hypothetical protein
MEPLSEFKPVVADPKQPAPAAGASAQPALNGKPVVRAEFFSVPFGTSALAEVRSESSDQPSKGKGEPTATVTANAVKISGFWRENADSEKIVSNLLKKLREKPGAFTFTVPGPDGKPLVLKDEQILKVTLASKDGGDLAYPFNITLPLAREVRVK